ncbi:Rha family transcriptional regulator [Paenibacillus sp. FSL L8-0708]|uniref:Rha family transcriptional regulator n=1 Tax=Paenibacillus sp. FSL L8-0708 TaxID=2975311 RepID=UPI0030FC01A3
MNNLVSIDNGRPVTDSLTVAEVFGKRHDRILQDIKELECSAEFSLHNFVESTYTNERGRIYPKYIITQDGFSFLVMGYTGKEAARFKEMYIKQFTEMRNQLNNKQTDPLKVLMQATHNLLASQELIVGRVDEIEQKVDKQITLDSGQQRRIQQGIGKKVCSIEPDKSKRGELFRQLHREIKDRWEVPSYKDVLRQDMQNVLNYISAWKPIPRSE